MKNFPSGGKNVMRFRFPRLPGTFEIPNEWLADAGAAGYVASDFSYVATGGQPIELVNIEPPFRASSVVLDHDGFSRQRFVSVLQAMVSGTPLPPVEARIRDERWFPPPQFSHRIVNGYHRYYAAVALGFSGIAVDLATAQAPMPALELAREMADDAVAYFLAAKKVAAGENAVSIIALYRRPVNSLLGHCCELALKSGLAAKGFAVDRLQNEIRHNLATALDEAAVWGVAVTDDFRTYCRIMADAHRDFDFRYAGHASPPWVGLDDAFGMIAPQLKTLPGLMTAYL